MLLKSARLEPDKLSTGLQKSSPTALLPVVSIRLREELQRAWSPSMAFTLLPFIASSQCSISQSSEVNTLY